MDYNEMKNIINSEVMFNKLEKNKGIYEFHQVGNMSIGVSYEDYIDGKETYIFNIFCGDEYINISSTGNNDETINELVKEWNNLMED